MKQLIDRLFNYPQPAGKRPPMSDPREWVLLVSIFVLGFICWAALEIYVIERPPITPTHWQLMTYPTVQSEHILAYPGH